MGSPRLTRGSGRRLVVVLAIAVGVVAGVLAMHFGVGPAPAEATSTEAVAVTEHPHHRAPTGAACADDCGPVDEEWHVAAACVLGFLVLQLVFAIPHSARPVGDIAAQSAAAPGSAPAPLARAPDLDILCISRT